MAGRPTVVRRHEWYVGPDKDILATTLDKFEAEGGWLWMPKIDGMFCVLEIRSPKSGRPHMLKSRDARTPEITGSAAGDLPNLNIPLPPGTILVGELEAASEWSTKQTSSLGFRRIHLFDVPFVPGEGLGDLRDQPTEARYAVLKKIHETVLAPDPVFSLRFPLVPAYTDRFRERYEAVVAAGGEGCVLKKASGLYRTTRLDGKTNEMVRCKKQLTEDYFLIGFAMTPGGQSKIPQKTARWGLFKDGKIVECLQACPPKELLVDENVGKLVCEWRGNERFASGALRHAVFVRVREDKAPEECLFR